MNIFADAYPVDPPRLMPRLRHAVAGLGALLDESMLCLAPHPNSYRRFRAGALAPSGRNWGYDHREVALRVPRSSEHNRRIEHRVAGADANPYLVAAAVLSGALNGIEKEIRAPEPINGDSYSKSYDYIPLDWLSAIDIFKHGRLNKTFYSVSFIETACGGRTRRSAGWRDCKWPSP